MSRLFEGLSRARMKQSQSDMVPADLVQPEPAAAEVPSETLPTAIGARGTVEMQKMFESEKTRSMMVQPPPTSRLVAWTDPNSLGAEKFRALAVRLDDM